MAVSHLDRLSSTDASFLNRRTIARTCTSARSCIFEGPPPATRVRSSTSRRGCTWCPVSARSLPSRRCSRARPVWVDDPRLNLEYHVRHSSLPRRATTSSCSSSIGRIFSQRLDRSKPLWEMWLVQGLEDNRFAIISKTHHALVDGDLGRRPRDGAVRRQPRAGRASRRRSVPWEPAARAERRAAARARRRERREAAAARRPARAERRAAPARDGVTSARGAPRASARSPGS